jgi:glucokinase
MGPSASMHAMATAAAATILRGGIDLGGTKIEAVVVDPGDRVLGAARRPTPREGGPPAVTIALAETLAAACRQAGIEPAALRGVGVGSPGLVDGRTGSVSQARNLPAWGGTFALAPTLAARLGTPVHVGNDVQVATEAEYRLGAGRGFASLLGVFWGTGVGGALILGGGPWLGRGRAGEIGHMVIKRGGARCSCGGRGCLEAYAGRAAMEARARRRAKKGRHTILFELMRERGRDRLTSAIWAQALERGDKLAAELLQQAVEALAVGIASAVNLLDVEAVVLGGGLGVRFGEPFARRIADAMRRHLFDDKHPPELRVAALGDLGGAIGAALLAGRTAG